MRISRSILAAISSLGLGGLTGCGVLPRVKDIGPGGIVPSAFISNATYPNSLESTMSYQVQFGSDDIELLGPVTSSGTTKNIMGIVTWGDSGYGLLLENARKSGADGVMNVATDTSYFNILFVYGSATTEVHAQAYRWKAGKAPAPRARGARAPASGG